MVKMCIHNLRLWTQGLEVSILEVSSLPPHCLTPGGTLTHISHDPYCADTYNGPLLTQVQHTKQNATDLV